jgi:hypothetical protein
MSHNHSVLDRDTLDRLEIRLKRGIPKWEQTHFIEQIVPMLVERLKDYIEHEPKS